MAQQNKKISEKEKEKNLEVHRALEEIIIQEVIDIFRINNIYSDPIDIYQVIESLQPLNDEIHTSWGDRLYVRDYNVNSDELYLVWKNYQDVHNECRKNSPGEILFDPLNWKGLAWELIRATKGLNQLEEQFKQDNGYALGNS